MKRDWDAMRQLLLKLELHDMDEMLVYSTAPKGNMAEKHSADLLAELNLLKCKTSHFSQNTEYKYSLTNHGYNLLEMIRDDGHWELWKQKGRQLYSLFAAPYAFDLDDLTEGEAK